MLERWISIILAISASGLGGNIINERGSHFFDCLGQYYTGIAAVIERMVFIAVGCVLFHRVCAKRDQSTTR